MRWDAINNLLLLICVCVSWQEEALEAFPPHPPSGASYWHLWSRDSLVWQRVLCPIWFQLHPAHLVGIHQDDGSRRAATGIAGGHPQRQLHEPTTQRLLQHSVHQ